MALLFLRAVGMYGMSEFYGTRDDTESIATIHRAIDLGLRFLTRGYLWLWRNEVSLEGDPRLARKSLSAKIRIVRDKANPSVRGDGKPEYVRASCDASLNGWASNDRPVLPAPR